MRVLNIVETLNKQRDSQDLSHIQLTRSEYVLINQSMEPYDDATVCRIFERAEQLRRTPQDIVRYINIDLIKRAIQLTSIFARKIKVETVWQGQIPLGDLLTFVETTNRLTYRCDKREVSLQLVRLNAEQRNFIKNMFASSEIEYQLFDDVEVMSHLLQILKMGLQRMPDATKYIFRRDPPLHQNSALDNTKTQRRYDALAKLLSVEAAISACIALTVFDGKLVISANPKKNVDPDTVISYLLIKIDIIRKFLNYSPDDSSHDKGLDVFMKAREMVEELVHRRHGGIGGSMVNFKDPEPSSKYLIPFTGPVQRAKLSLTDALLKLRADFLSGEGAIKELCEAIFKPFTFVKGRQCGEHAEQLILKYVFGNAQAESFDKRLPIGIDKQCCYDCAHVMHEYSSYVSVQGYSLNKFPGVLRRGERVSLYDDATDAERRDSSHPESDSDPELDGDIKLFRRRQYLPAELRAARLEGLQIMRSLGSVPRIAPVGDSTYNVEALSPSVPFPRAPSRFFFSAEGQERISGADGIIANP